MLALHSACGAKTDQPLATNGERAAWSTRHLGPDAAGHRAHPFAGRAIHAGEGVHYVVRVGRVVSARRAKAPRRRDTIGSTSLDQPGLFRLQYLVSTWVERLRQNMRMTVEDTRAFKKSWELHAGDFEPIVRHYRSTRRSSICPVSAPGAHLWEHIAHAEAEACCCDLRGVSGPADPGLVRRLTPRA